MWREKNIGVVPQQLDQGGSTNKYLSRRPVAPERRAKAGSFPLTRINRPNLFVDNLDLLVEHSSAVGRQISAVTLASYSITSSNWLPRTVPLSRSRAIWSQYRFSPSEMKSV